jgi:hypothetical protein
MLGSLRQHRFPFEGLVFKGCAFKEDGLIPSLLQP